jgi:hypothetical protein
VVFARYGILMTAWRRGGGAKHRVMRRVSPNTVAAAHPAAENWLSQSAISMIDRVEFERAGH